MRRHLPLGLVICFTCFGVASHAGAQQPVVVEGATVVSPHMSEPQTDVSVLIGGGRILSVGRTDEMSVPAGAVRIDGRGKWVTPGIVEVHTHTSSAEGLKRGLALGVTTAQVISRPTSPDESESWAEAEREMLRLKAEGVRAVKIWQDDGTLWFPPEQAFPSIPPGVMEALVRAAHGQGMRVVVHAWKLPYFAEAVEAGVDGLIHPVADALVPSSVWNDMRQQRLTWTTSMTVFLTFGDIPQYARRVLSDPRLAEVLSPDARASLREDTLTTEFARYSAMPTLRANRQRYIHTVQQNTRNALASGVDVVVGSDATVGIGTHIEMELMAEAGKLADVLVLNSNPLDDIRNLRDIHLVLKGGHVFAPERLIRGPN